MVRALQSMYNPHVPRFYIFVLAGLVGLCGLFHVSRDLLPAESRMQGRLWVHALVSCMVSARYQPLISGERGLLCVTGCRAGVPVGTQLGGAQSRRKLYFCAL